MTEAGRENLSEELSDIFNEGDRLVLTPIHLDRHRNHPLPPATLQAIEAGLGQVRRAGLKTIVRASYNQPGSETGYRGATDAPGERVLEHIAQLGPILQRNRDVIAFTQAGFIGAWGEWHSSSNGLTSAEWRARIGNALLTHFPGPVQFRYPRDVERSSTPANMSRIGMHNDCFLASATDVGTYSDDAATRRQQRSTIAERSRTAPFGGETCRPADAENPHMRLGCDDVRAEAAAFNLMYLNRGYNRAFHASWERNGCFPEVESRMGPRLRFEAVGAPAEFHVGRTATLDFNVVNDGWSRMHNPVDPVMHLWNPATNERRNIALTFETPVRDWLPGIPVVTRASFTVPQDLPNGDWRLGIAMPDASPRLREDVRYSTRPANVDVRDRGQYWDPQRGVFFVGLAFRVGD